MLFRSRGEASLVEETLESRFTRRTPQRLIGDKAYDSTKLEGALKAKRIELISPQIRTRADHQRRATRRRQDGRPLRRYRRRWKIERLWAWLLLRPLLLLRQLLPPLPLPPPLLLHPPQ